VLALIECVLGDAAFVVMMQTAHFTNLDHSTLCWWLYSSGLRCVFVERQVSSPPMVQLSNKTPILENREIFIIRGILGMIAK
jgi:hypothetical protein